MKKNRWVNWATALLAVLVLGVGALALSPQVMQAAEPQHGIGGQRGGGTGASDSHLAQALNITVEQLEAAQESARNSAIDEALAQGLITQAQADALKAQDGVRGLSRMAGMLGLETDTIDQQALLASALNITVEQLEAAEETAKDLALAEAVASGRITQEQADLMQAREALSDFMGDRMENAYNQAVQEAVTAGVITQEQADAILSGNRGSRFEGRGQRGAGSGRFQSGRGGRGFPGGQSLPNQSAPQGSSFDGAAGL